MISKTSQSAGVRVDIRGLQKSFGRQRVLNGIDLEIGGGEIFVIIGPSGSGKSVLLKHIMGLEQPDAGEIRINDQLISDERTRAQHRMAMVFQSGGLLNSLTVAENVGLFLTEHRLKPAAEVERVVAEKLALVQLAAEVAGKYPEALSGGMRKRVAIARALVIEPELILYDEPTSELDPLVAFTIGREILGLNQRLGTTSIVVTHDRDLALGIADRVAFLADGKILASGTPEAVRQQPIPLLQQFLDVQFRSMVAG